MRREWTLALLAACATERGQMPPALRPEPVARVEPDAPTDDLAEEVRGFVEKHWSKSVALGLEFPAHADAEATRLEVEREMGSLPDTWWRGSSPPYLFLSAVAHGATADVLFFACGNRWGVRYACRGWPSGKRSQLGDPRIEECVEVRRGTMSRADFDRLLRKVALLQGAKLREAPEGAFAGEEPRTVWTGTFSVQLDRQRRIEPRRHQCYTSMFDDDARAVLIHELIWSEAGRWTLIEAEDDGTIGHALLQGLVTEPISWRRPCRVRALGYLGCDAAIPDLERLVPRGEDVDEALTQIRLLHECKTAQSAPPLLVELATADPRSDAGWRLRFWAERVLAERFPPDYRAWLRRRFEAGDQTERVEVLEELHCYDASDLTLARLACGDPDPGLRTRGAVLLDDAALLLGLARDATLPPDTRRGAIRALSGTTSGSEKEPARPLGDRKVVGDALVALLADPAREVRTAAVEGLVALRCHEPAVCEALFALLEDPEYEVRAAAANGALALGCRDVVPGLIRAMVAALAAQRGVVAADMAAVLGRLGARDAIEPIDKALLGKSPGTFRYRVCFSLACIDDARVLPILEREREKHRPDPRAYDNWSRSLLIHIALEGERSRRDVSQELSDRFTTYELRTFLDDPDLAPHRAVLARALSLE
jgi:HEAT repeats